MTTYYVTKAGNNSNAGTLAAPFLTIQRGVNALSAPGDRLVINDNGVYAEAVTVNIKNGTLGNEIVIENGVGFTPVMDGTTVSQTGDSGLLAVTSSQHIIIQGLEIRGYQNHGILLGTAAYRCTVQNNHIHDGTGSSIFINDGGNTPGGTPKVHKILNNHCHGNAGGGITVLTDRSGYIKIKDNNVHDNGGTGNYDNIQVGSGSGSAHHVVVQNNVTINSSAQAALGSDALDLGGHESANPIHHFLVEGNEVHGTFKCHCGDSVTGMTFIPGQSGFTIVRNNRFVNCLWDVYEAPNPFVAYHNVWYDGTGGIQFWRFYHDAAATRAVAETLGDSTYVSGSDVGRANLKNNIFFTSVTSGSSYEYITSVDTSGAGVTAHVYLKTDYNSIKSGYNGFKFPTSGAQVAWGNIWVGSPATFFTGGNGILAAWQAANATYTAEVGSRLTNQTAAQTFANPGNGVGTQDFTLLAGSDFKGVGTPLQVAKTAGTASTSLSVDRASWFFDGYPIPGTSGETLATPDTIIIGVGGTPVQIVAINDATNTITLASPRTWAANDPVHLAVVGNPAAPDLGLLAASSAVSVSIPPQSVTLTQGFVGTSTSAPATTSVTLPAQTVTVARGTFSVTQTAPAATSVLMPQVFLSAAVGSILASPVGPPAPLVVALPARVVGAFLTVPSAFPFAASPPPPPPLPPPPPPPPPSTFTPTALIDFDKETTLPQIPAVSRTGTGNMWAYIGKVLQSPAMTGALRRSLGLSGGSSPWSNAGDAIENAPTRTATTGMNTDTGGGKRQAMGVTGRMSNERFMPVIDLQPLMDDTAGIGVEDPLSQIEPLLDATAALKETVEVWAGRRGDALDEKISWRDLLSLGVVTVTANGQTIGQQVVGGIPQIPVPSWVQPPAGLPDYTPPPAPAGFTATGGQHAVVLTWTAFSYANHALVEVWRNTANNIGTAVRIGTTQASVYADTVDPGTTYYYWIRAQSETGIFGPFSASASASTAGSVGDIISSLTGAITETQLASTLLGRINKIDTTNGGLTGQYVLKVDNNGYVAGFGLAAGTPTTGSEFIILADRFSIIAGGSALSVTSLTRFNQIATATVAGHPFQTGDTITIQGADQPEYNVRGTVGATTTNTFTYTIVGSPVTPATGTIVVRRSSIPFIVGTVNGKPAVVMSSAMIADASINNAQIGNAAIDDAKIANLSAGKITSGTISTAVLQLFDSSFTLDGPNQTLTITDKQSTPRNRVMLGKLGAGTANYGLILWDAAGNQILNAGGLAAGVVGTAQLAAGAITATTIAAGTITADKIVINGISNSAQSVVSQVSLTTTSATPVVTVTYTVASGAQLLVSYTGFVFMANTSGSTIDLRADTEIRVDGSTQAAGKGAALSRQPTGQSTIFPISGSAVVSGLSAGSHTFAVAVTPSSVTGVSIPINSADMTLTVLELKR